MKQQFVETIKIQDGKAKLLPYHQARMESTFRHFFQETDVPQLRALLQPTPDMHLYKVRVVYGNQGIEAVQYAPYSLREIHALKVVSDNRIDYSFKRTDRTDLNHLVAKKGKSDDIIIIKNGRVTDTSFSNIALFDGSRWLTPQRPLLRGTQRAFLLEKGILQEADITLEHLMKARKVSLINAMMELGECEVLVDNIRV